MKPKTILKVTLILLLLSITSGLQGQASFPIGVWAFAEDYDDNDPIYEDGNGLHHLLNSEKQLLLDLGVNYLIATGNVDVEEALIRFGEEQDGNFRTTLQWAPVNTPLVTNPYEPWRASYKWGNYPESAWIDTVQHGYTAMNNVYGTSSGLHSFIVGGEKGINNQSRWDEVDYMCEYVSGLGQQSVVQDGWHANEPDFVYNVENMDMFMMQVYPFTTTTPYTGPNHQAAIQLMADRWSAIISAIIQKNQTYGTNSRLIAIVQTQESNRYDYRYPTSKEILCSINMALCSGARGIIYYLYAYSDYGGGDYEQGLLDDNRQPTAYYDSVKFINDNYQDLGKSLSEIGSEFVVLTWDTSALYHKLCY